MGKEGGGRGRGGERERAKKRGNRKRVGGGKIREVRRGRDKVYEREGRSGG
jgi:hypothetical protein